MSYSPKQLAAEMATRDLMSATESLIEIPGDLLRSEIDEIELAHERLSRVIKRICKE